MGKGLGVFGNFRKRVGNVVGYKLTNSNNQQTQGLRIYQPTVSNPKTAAQVEQRRKLTPLSAFYDQSSAFLDHAFQGLTQGYRNRQRFMKLNMAANSEAIVPPVVKGDSALYPGVYKVATGSLGYNLLPGWKSNATIADSDQHVVVDGIKMSGDDAASTMTLAEFSANIIAANPGIVDGMEIAVLAMFRVGDLDGSQRYYFERATIVLDTTDTVTSVSDVLPASIGLFNVNESAVAGNILINSQSNDVVLAGAAIFISSKSGDGWKYGNSTFKWTFAEYTYWNSRALYDACVASYQSTASEATSDLELQQADNTSGSTSPTDVVSTSTRDMSSSLISSLSGATLSSNNAMIANLRNGTIRFVVNADGTLVTADGTAITITPSGEEARAFTLADTTYGASAPTVLYGSFQ